MTSRIGPFALEELLPSASCTYRAMHVDQRRAVALKVFTAPFGANQDARQAFAAEWERLKRLKHPHIVRCFGGGLHEAQGYLAYEWLPQTESLREVLARRDRLPADQVVEYAKQIVAALEFAHEEDVPHLALMPEKVLVTADETLKLADFRVERETQAAFRSTAGVTLERARYLAPEQFRSDVPTGPKADMYALGCVLYELLTGTTPFVGTSVEFLERAHQEDTPERVTRIVLDCPIWLDALVHQLLEKDPLKRPHSMAAVRLALDEAERKMAQRVSVAEHVTGGISALKTDASRKEAEQLLGHKRKRKRQAAVDAPPFYERAWFLVLCLVLLAAVGVWAMWPPDEETLFRKAEALIATGADGADRRARDDYLLPLLRRFPDGKYAAEAQAHIDRMDMELAETRLRVKLKLGRELNSEGERLLAEAWQFQQFGDTSTALEKFKSMRDLLPDDEDNRSYRNLAQREIEKLQAAGVSADRQAFLEERLKKADELLAAGDKAEALKIWRSIVSLYSGSVELAALVETAQTHIKTLTEGG